MRPQLLNAGCVLFRSNDPPRAIYRDHDENGSGFQAREPKSRRENFLVRALAGAINPGWLTGARKRLISPGTNPKNPIFRRKTLPYRAQRDAEMSVNYVWPAKVNAPSPLAGASELALLELVIYLLMPILPNKANFNGLYTVAPARGRGANGERALPRNGSLPARIAADNGEDFSRDIARHRRRG